MKLWPLVLALVTFPAVIGACCADQHRPVVYHASPLARLRLHGDTNFTPLERGLIEQAARDLTIQTGGWLDVQILWDFDMSGTVEELKAGNTLVRKNSFDLLVLMVDAKRNGTILGLTVRETHQTFLVADRLETPAMWRHVVMHELLHSAGLDDIYDPKKSEAIMFWATTGAEPVTCMRRADADEFCRIHFCDAERLNFCDG